MNSECGYNDVFPRPCLSSTLVVHRVQEFSLSTHYKSFSCLFMPHKGMRAAAPGLQLRQVSCYRRSDKTMRCVQWKTLLAEKQKGFGPTCTRHPINSKLVTNVIYFIAELLKFMIFFSFFLNLWLTCSGPWKQILHRGVRKPLSE